MEEGCYEVFGEEENYRSSGIGLVMFELELGSSIEEFLGLQNEVIVWKSLLLEGEILLTST